MLHLGLRLVRRFRRHRGACRTKWSRGARRSDETGVVHDWDEVIAGEAMEGGPVMLSWRDVAQAGATRRDGYNVVIHEFVHKIDMRDGAPDGCPPLPIARARARRWLAVLQPRVRALPRKGDHRRALRRRGAVAGCLWRHVASTNSSRWRARRTS